MKEHTRCTTIDISGPVEVLHARYYEHAFAPHWHEEYAVGLIDAGVEQFWSRGKTHLASAGELVLLNAGEVHTGESYDERGFGFQMMYIPESTLLDLARSMRPRSGSVYFAEAVMRNGRIYEALRQAHLSFEHGSSRLEYESRFVSALANLLREAGTCAVPSQATPKAGDLLPARDYLQDHLFDEVPLGRLAQIAGMSKYHFLRAFRRSFGLPPHAYQLQHRVFHAKRLLKSLPPAEVAHQCGFSDQSHLHRAFWSFAGTTPGKYAEQFRPIRISRQQDTVR